jgi:hypothetical protein
MGSRSSGRSPVLFELFGLPGAGKTTITNAAAPGLTVVTRKDLSASWNRRTQLYRSTQIARGIGNVSGLTAGVRFAWRAHLASPESLLRLAHTIAKTHWLRSQSGVMLLDQGFLQDLWSMVFAAGCEDLDPAILAPFIEQLYSGIDTRIVVINVDADTARKRVSGRAGGNSRFDALPIDDLSALLPRATTLQRCIVAAARSANLRLEYVDGSMPVDALGNHLRRLISFTRV